MVIRKFPAKISRAPTTDRRDQRFNNNNNNNAVVTEGVGRRLGRVLCTCDAARW